ncbi:MAG: hypothetical protein ABJK28_01155 [Algibacter sp.]
MKKLILIALAFVAIQATAQEEKRNHKKGDHQKGQAFAQLSAEEIATIQTKKMTLRLDLNASQQREIQEINLEEAIARKAHMEERKAKKESDTAEKPSKEDRVAKMNKMLDHKIEVKAKMKKILNDEQYAKWEADQEKRSKNRKGNGKSHKGERKK